MDVVRVLLIEAHVLLSYWREALDLVTYLINLVSSNFIDFQIPL